MNPAEHTNPYQFWNELKEELKQKTGKEELEVEKSTYFNLRLIRKLESLRKGTRKVVEFRKYLTLLEEQKRLLPEEQRRKIKHLFFFLMNQPSFQPRTGTTETEKRFSRYDASVRTNRIRFQNSNTNRKNQQRAAPTESAE